MTWPTDGSAVSDVVALQVLGKVLDFARRECCCLVEAVACGISRRQKRETMPTQQAATKGTHDDNKTTSPLTMTTLTEDVSNNCQSSDLVGVSDGVMTAKKNSGKSGLVMSAIGSRVSKDTVKRHCVEMSAQSTKKT